MKWLLEQLNFGNFESQRDSDGALVSMTIAKSGAPQDVSEDEVLEHAKRRLLAVNLAEVMAQGRESGIPPGLAQFSKTVKQQSTEWGHRNAEFHYAFELVKVLARLNKKTFNLEAPPITGLAPYGVVSYLRESTRCWLYGFHGASIALSRACVEDSLRSKLTEDENGSNLERLIDAARRRGLLDDCMAEVAHTVRRTANRYLHGKNITEKDSRASLAYCSAQKVTVYGEPSLNGGREKLGDGANGTVHVVVHINWKLAGEATSDAPIGIANVSAEVK